MDVFELRDRLIGDYRDYVRSFLQVRDHRIRRFVEEQLGTGSFWPEPRVALNPSFELGRSIGQLVDDGILHPRCRDLFRRRKDGAFESLRLYRHQEEAILAARTGKPYVLTTGTGSGKSLAYIVPIVDHVLRTGSGRGIQAIVVYPMNALANSQLGELGKFLAPDQESGRPPVTFRRYTGQERLEEREEILRDPPDVLLTNYVMLELILTRVWERELVRAARGLRFLVLDELHTYRGRQGADVAMLVRRVREATASPELQCVGTSATLASEGTAEEQRSQVAQVASEIFGSPVEPASVIVESLRRLTAGADPEDPGFVARLRRRLEEDRPPPLSFEAFRDDPLSAWIETALGVTAVEGGRLVRPAPRALSGPGGAAEELARLVGLPPDRCLAAIKAQLLAGYEIRHPETDFPVFAFRLHQFIRRGDTVYTTLEEESRRYLTLRGQRFAPGDRRHLLYPLVFCRECGQEYLAVRAEGEGAARRFDSPLGGQLDAESEPNGYLYVSSTDPWPQDPAAEGRLPEDWLDEGGRLLPSYRKLLPEAVRLDGLGRPTDDPEATPAWFEAAPFRLCLACGVAYSARQTEFLKLATLGAGGRSSATTILCLEAIRSLRRDGTLDPSARKVLTFTDNRQDASLQAGHFNDFVQVGLLRSALYRAVDAAPEGLTHELLTQRVFDQLALPFEAYAQDPGVRYQGRSETERALRSVLGYRLYLDQERGWRLTFPNLERCGLLEIVYESLSDLCHDQDEWSSRHPALATASPSTRERICKTLLDFMRRGLAIKVDYLEERFQEALVQLSSQRLRTPWALDENEKPRHATILFPRSRRPKDYGGFIFLSARSGFGQYLRRPTTFPDWPGPLKLADTEAIIRSLLEALCGAGLVQVVRPGQGDDQVPGYQLVAAAMRWTVGDGKRAFHDPIRVPNQPEEGLRPNPYFVEYYRSSKADHDIEAREHTAQVPDNDRLRREEAFRRAELPVLFCSPTMELGVDIAELNVVGMRNVPPTPANYAQRSGRAGRRGQPALVFTYCTTGSPHDQYFFARPERMIAGQVSPPRLDLTNEDLVRAHVHAIWLAEAGTNLGNSLKEVLDVRGEHPNLEVLPSIQADLTDPEIQERTRERARQVLAAIPGLEQAPWWEEGWLEETVRGLPQRFEAACERWRSLYRAAAAQRELQNRIIGDAARSQKDKDRARRLRSQAETQLGILLADDQASFQSDFNSYRYFASEGFLPGYSFPRLPLSAFIPGRRARTGEDEFLSRPRFLAISEFGPRNLLYHEGSRYEINQVMLPVAEGEGNLLGPATETAKRCPGCGYLHPITDEAGPDRCERCGEELEGPIRELFRLQNVSTRRRDRINCDEEERTRLGYELRSAVRFPTVRGRPAVETAEVHAGTERLARLTYAQAATIWRINLGWKQRREDQQGFLLDLETGYWKRASADAPENEVQDDEEPMGPRVRRVVPFVEDRRNCLLLDLEGAPEAALSASVQWALAAGMQAVFQLEDGELAAEPLPDERRRRTILFYEAAEGGAGALRRLVQEPRTLREVARAALEICHFDPDTGEDRRRAPGAAEDCEAACYDCLLNYRNQPDHRLLDRQLLPGLLRALAGAEVAASPGPERRDQHLAHLLERAGSELERRWLRLVEESGYRLPDEAQVLIPGAGTRPDFVYRVHDDALAVYVDGPPHEFPDRACRDAEQTAALEDRGWIVLRFREHDDWPALLAQYPSFFGRREG
ncbi:MAG TPA: DEAD/DEAH box helicase [Candidatus Dormibacteraeota bacterium]|nr:DEAD/DEAH box helicase [Candidatus Dormibacteraeota bacterium]